MLIHQSHLQAAKRCWMQAGYELKGLPREQSSAAAFGTCVHYALQQLERLRSEGADFAQALQTALEIFAFYWNPLNISAITDPVPADGWLPSQSYVSLRKRGLEMIQRYADLIRYEELHLLGLEFSFIVPIDNTWDEDLDKPHELAGTIDRLALRHYSRKLTVAVDDWKTGIVPKQLRYELQFSAYAYATTKREFWVGYGGEDGFGEEMGEELYERLRPAARRGTWIDLRTAKFTDAGWRGPIDYARFALAVEQYAALAKADIWPLTLSGDTCPYCPYRASCGGTGIPSKDHGDPRSTS